MTSNNVGKNTAEHIVVPLDQPGDPFSSSVPVCSLSAQLSSDEEACNRLGRVHQTLLLIVGIRDLDAEEIFVLVLRRGRTGRSGGADPKGHGGGDLSKRTRFHVTGRDEKKKVLITKHRNLLDKKNQCQLGQKLTMQYNWRLVND